MRGPSPDLSDNTRADRRRGLMIAAAATAIVFVLWNVSQLSFIVYPLKLFVTYVHEAGHSIAALLTGGSVRRFQVSADMSGLATTAGGIRALILPAGYLGAAFFGSLLFYIVNRFPRAMRTVGCLLGGAMILFTILFARPDERWNPMAIIIGIAFGAALIFIATKTRPWINLLLLKVLAISTALDAVLDIWHLLRSIHATRGSIHNDAAAFSREVMPFVPPAVIALSWCVIAALMFAVSCYYAIWKPFRSEVDDAYATMKFK